MKKKLLLIELKALEEKISLYEDESITVNNVPEGSKPKNIQTKEETLSQQTDLTQGNSKAIPQQTAAGKESTNPLMAAALPKSILKETTTPIPYGKTSSLASNATAEGISKMTILSSAAPKKDANLRPDYKKALDKPADRYYVIYKGPHAGIHTDWGIVETFIKTDKVTCKKFISEVQARASLAFSQEVSTTTQKSKTLIRPKIKEANRDQRFNIPKEVEERVLIKSLSFEDFRMIWKKVRAAGPEDLIHENFYSTDKKIKSLYNFLEGADPALIYDAFSAGLVDNIYPSQNLQELKFFPRPMVESIKTFRKKVLKAKDDPIYIKVISSLPEWQHEAYYAPYHYLEVGLAKGKKEINQSLPMEENLPEIHNLRVTGLRRIAEKVIDILSGSKKKVNYADTHCMITSWSWNNTNDEDIELASAFGEKFKNNTLDATANTKEVFCRQADALFEEHYCNFCKSNSTTKEDPSTEETLSSASGSI